jgi:hypothetical protein
MAKEILFSEWAGASAVHLGHSEVTEEEESKGSTQMKRSKTVNLQRTAFQTSVMVYEAKKRTASSSLQEYYENVGVMGG